MREEQNPQLHILDLQKLLASFAINLMYSTEGIEAVATITELRSNTSELVNQAKELERGILIQKNNDPYAVLLSYDQYKKLVEAKSNDQ